MENNVVQGNFPNYRMVEIEPLSAVDLAKFISNIPKDQAYSALKDVLTDKEFAEITLPKKPKGPAGLTPFDPNF